MREVKINGYEVSTYHLGVVGEHNATKLIITPPKDLINDAVAYYRVQFKLRNKTNPVITQEYYTYPIEVMLVQALTLNTSLTIQIVAYDNDGNYLGISKKIDGFYFDASDYNACADHIKEWMDDPIIGLRDIINSKASIEYVDTVTSGLEEQIEEIDNSKASIEYVDIVVEQLEEQIEDIDSNKADKPVDIVESFTTPDSGISKFTPAEIMAKDIQLLLFNGLPLLSKESVSDDVKLLYLDMNTVKVMLLTVLADKTFTTVLADEQLMTAEQSTKLAGIEAEANKYILPSATDSVLGGIKVGQNLEIEDDGTLNAIGGGDLTTDEIISVCLTDFIAINNNYLGVDENTILTF